MKQIIVTVGMSNSGKSTFANTAVQHNPDRYVVINRDKIRELLFGYTETTISEYYTRNDVSAREKQVTRYEDTLINEALETGRIPIVDATHLKRTYLERFKYWNVEVELMFFDVLLKEAQVRNESRLRQVPADILKKQYNQYVGLRNDLDKNPIDFTPVEFINDTEKHPIMIYDIDGTLAHKGDRSPYDWKAVGKDTVDLPTKFVANRLAGRTPVQVSTIICTGRDRVCTEETKKWLSDNRIHYDRMYIREEGDMRPDWIVKEEMWRKIAEDFYIVGMFDDRLQVVRRARALGLKVFNVEYNNF